MWRASWILSGALAHAADIRQTPLNVASEPFDGHARIVAEWGTQGDVLRRDPRSVAAQHQELVLWLTSPDAVRQLGAQQQALEGTERQQAVEAAGLWRKAWDSTPQEAGVPAAGARAQRRAPLPAWLRVIQPDLRRLIVVCLIDARSEAQVAWADTLKSTTTPEAQVLALGWESLSDLQRLGVRYPAMQVVPVGGPGGSGGGQRSGAAWAADYGVVGLPALVRVDGDTLVIEEGL